MSATTTTEEKAERNGTSKALATKALPPQQALKQELDKYRGAMLEILPKHVTPERIIKVVLSATARNSDILKCTTQSICRAVMQAAELGLEIGGLLGEAYLVPFERKWQDEHNKWHTAKEAQCITGYKGLIKLARQSGQIASIAARVVYENDVFDVDLANEQIAHRPNFKERGSLIAVYGIARFKEGGQQIEVMTLDEVEKIRARSKAKDAGPWKTDYEEMARKTVVRRLCKYLPLSPELAKALEIDDDAEGRDAPAVDVQLMTDKPRAKALAEQIASRAAAAQTVDVEPAHDAETGEVIEAEEAKP